MEIIQLRVKVLSCLFAANTSPLRWLHSSRALYSCGELLSFFYPRISKRRYWAGASITINMVEMLWVLIYYLQVILWLRFHCVHLLYALFF